MKTDNQTAWLITKPENIFYVTNFSGKGFVIKMNDRIMLATDQRYRILAKNIKKKSVYLFDLKTGWENTLNLRMEKIRTVYYEENHLTIAELSHWKKILPKRHWKKGKRYIEAMRLIKRDDELDRLREAARIGDQILKKSTLLLKPGVTEKMIANELRRLSNERADGVSFDPIVSFGKNCAIPHHHSGQTRLRKDDVIMIDQGVQYRGYMSDMTRCFFIGKGVDHVRDMYECALNAQEIGVKMVKPGMNISEIATTVRASLGKEEKYFTHGLGHGIGLEIHEDPMLSTSSNTILKPGMVITIEPGLYKEDIGGVRVEDTVIVTKNACEIITQSSKKTDL